jgi:hypothetical protein
MVGEKKEGRLTMIQLSKSRRSLVVAALSVAVAVPLFAGTALADAADPAASQVASVAEEGARFGHEGTRVNVAGEVAKYVVGPLGHVRGFLLKDGTAVVLHGASGDTMAKDVPLGQSVRVEGWSPASSAGKAVMRAAVYGQQGQIVSPPARGERGEAGREERMEARKEERKELRSELERLPEAGANGTVQAIIPGHRGKTMAVVLSDGTSVFLRRSLAKAVMARGIRVGDQIQSSGRGATYPLGASVLATSLTFADGSHFEAGAGQAGR